MNTTLLFAELLIIGVQSGVWLFLAIITIFGYEWFINSTPSIKDLQAILIALLLPVFYIFGIIVDRISDKLFEVWNSNLKKEIIGNAKVSVGVMRYSIGKENQSLNQQIEYTRTRIRITRASALNFLVTSINAALFVFIQLVYIPLNQRWFYVIIILVIGLILCLTAVFTWRSLTTDFLKLVKNNYEFMSSNKSVIKIGEGKRKTQ